jgi:4-hydroxybenzoate polyprenyltransferase
MSIKPVLALCRVSNLPTVWMNVLTAAVLTDPFVGWHQVAVLALALSCFYCGGMAMNDLCDLPFDRIHQPHRPIVAQRLTKARAQATMLLLFVSGLALLTLVSTHTQLSLGSGAGLLAVIWIYNAYHKEHPAAAFVMGVTRMMVYVVTGLALSGQIESTVWIAAVVQTGYVIALTGVARAEHRVPGGRYTWPVIPWLIALIPIIDGIVLAVLASPWWLLFGIAASALTRFGQRYVRGD